MKEQIKNAIVNIYSGKGYTRDINADMLSEIKEATDRELLLIYLEALDQTKWIGEHPSRNNVKEPYLDRVAGLWELIADTNASIRDFASQYAAGLRSAISDPYISGDSLCDVTLRIFCGTVYMKTSLSKDIVARIENTAQSYYAQTDGYRKAVKSMSWLDRTDFSTLSCDPARFNRHLDKVIDLFNNAKDSSQLYWKNQINVMTRRIVTGHIIYTYRNTNDMHLKELLFDWLYKTYSKLCYDFVHKDPVISEYYKHWEHREEIDSDVSLWFVTVISGQSIGSKSGVIYDPRKATLGTFAQRNLVCYVRSDIAQSINKADRSMVQYHARIKQAIAEIEAEQKPVSVESVYQYLCNSNKKVRMAYIQEYMSTVYTDGSMYVSLEALGDTGEVASKNPSPEKIYLNNQVQNIYQKAVSTLGRKQELVLYLLYLGQNIITGITNEESQKCIRDLEETSNYINRNHLLPEQITKKEIEQINSASAKKLRDILYRPENKDAADAIFAGTDEYQRKRALSRAVRTGQDRSAITAALKEYDDSIQEITISNKAFTIGSQLSFDDLETDKELIPC